MYILFVALRIGHSSSGCDEINRFWFE